MGLIYFPDFCRPTFYVRGNPDEISKWFPPAEDGFQGAVVLASGLLNAAGVSVVK